VLSLRAVKVFLMNLYTSKQELTLELEKQRKNNNKIGLVPTMGSLHEGHYSLVHKALEVSETVWVSIFVNPTQFNDKKDFTNYPKNLKKDIETLIDISKNIKIFAPSAKEIYGENIKPQKFDFGYIGEVLEGKYREDHFNGVATIVTKLLDLFKPDFVFFGEKDFQQILIVQKIIDESFHKTNLIRCKTIRSKNGLALSSRNNLLNKKDYDNSNIIHEMLVFSKKNLMKIPYQKMKSHIISEINKVENFKLEYFEIRDEKTLFEIKKNSINTGLRAFISVKVNSVRLIDNYLLN
tara:strand:+ start:24310 stop:25191 length:882 start_codon:yes stop_codon:yes gene_type:complete